MPETKPNVKMSLVQLFISNFKEMHHNWKTVLTIYAFILGTSIATVKFLINDYTNYQKEILPLTNEQLKIEAENERRKTKYNDSITFVQAQKQTLKAFKAESEIQKEVDRLQRELPNCTAVNYWSVHNHGKPFQVDGKWFLEVYTTSNIEVEKDFKEDFPPIYRGLRWLALDLLENGQVYYEDVTQYPQLYIAKTKTILDLNDTKAFIGEYIRNDGNQFLYVTFDFNVVNPDEQIPDLRKEMRNFARFVRQKLH